MGEHLYVAYLDEFGHIGPYVSRHDPQHRTHPAFGLAGFVIPLEKTRELAMFFFKLKNRLLDWEIQQAGIHQARWEKKGAALFTTQNVLKYRAIRQATNRILNWITANGGYVFYTGLEKDRGAAPRSPEGLYAAVLRQSIRKISAACGGDKFLLILDEHGKVFREKAVAAASTQMFSEPAAFNLLEPPMQVESHLYQTVQCADWICGLIGRLAAYRTDPAYSDFAWAETYFGDRIARAATANSGLKLRERPSTTPSLANGLATIAAPKPGSWL